MIDETTRNAERQVIGAVLASPRALDEVAQHIKPDDLWDPRHALILEAALAVQQSGVPVEPITVAEHLGKEVKRAGGTAYLFELHGDVVNTSSADYLAEHVVRAASITRRVVEVGTRLATLDGTSDPLGAVDAARAALDNIAVGRSERTTVEQDVYAAIEELEAAPGLPTPWRDLTEVLGGWRPGALYYLGARPGVGKSTAALEAVIDMARRNRHVLVASLEMSRTELYHKLLSNVGNVDNKRILHRNLDEKDYERLARAAKHIAALPMHVNDSGSQTVADIRASARSIMRESDGNLGLIVVDYLQLMSSGQRVESRQQEVSGFSRALKLLAKELHVPVLALSQLNRGSEARHDKRPSLSDMRESGSLEQDGDAVLLLHREKDDPTGIELVVAKNRFGPADKAIRLDWSGCYSRISDALPAYRNY